MNFSEKRRYARVSCFFKTHISKPSPVNFSDAVITDLSVGGAGLLTDLNFKPPSPCLIEIELITGKRLRIVGEVKWLKRDMLEGKNRIGVEFFNLSEEAGEIIETKLIKLVTGQK